MTDIKRKALELVNEVEGSNWLPHETDRIRNFATICRAIERHEAFRQEVSDAAVEYNECGAQSGWLGFDHFIIPKPDPFLIEAREVCARVEEERNSLDWATRYRSGQCDELGWVKHIRAALAARGLEIREKQP